MGGTLALTPDGKPILNLPARNVVIEQCAFDSDERAFYDALEQQTSMTISKVRSGKYALMEVCQGWNCVCKLHKHAYAAAAVASRWVGSVDLCQRATTRRW